MEDTISPAILIPIIMACFIIAVWLTASFCNQRWKQEMQDVRQDLKTSSQHLEQCRKLYLESNIELTALKSQAIRISDAKAAMNNKLVAIRNALETKSISEIALYILDQTEGFTTRQELQNPPIKRGAHSVYIDGNGEPKIKSQQL